MSKILQFGSIHRYIPSVLRDNRGVTAILFALTATVMLLFVGLGVQSGTWYLAKRHGQNAADAAAIAGAVGIYWANYPNNCVSGTPVTAAQTTAQANVSAAATLNGLSGSGVTVTANVPPVSGSYTSDNCAAQAVVTQTQPPAFAVLAGQTGSISIVNAATARLAYLGNVCLLALGGNGNGRLNFSVSPTGSGTSTDAACIPASNSTDGSAIWMSNGVTVSPNSLYAIGKCSPCYATPRLPLLQNQVLPVINPFAAMDSLTVPSYGTVNCKPGYTPGPHVYYPTIGPQQDGLPWCGTNGLTLKTIADIAYFLPGTYIFQAAPLSATAGTLQCVTDAVTKAPCVSPNGVTFIFTGAPLKGPAIAINGSVTLNLPAPATASWSAPAANGLVFYQPTSTTGSVTILSTDTTGTGITGGLYFPGTSITYGVSAGSGSCTVLVAEAMSVEFGSFGTAGCAATVGTPVATVAAVRLWE